VNGESNHTSIVQLFIENPGNLALSRALGDFEFKKNFSLIPEKQVITADPDVTHHEIIEEDEFFVIACDGVFRPFLTFLSLHLMRPPSRHLGLLVVTTSC
jgi:serine/threonine protein phosphatase PrpC